MAKRRKAKAKRKRGGSKGTSDEGVIAAVIIVAVMIAMIAGYMYNQSTAKKALLEPSPLVAIAPA
jgi:hypothetical protein